MFCCSLSIQHNFLRGKVDLCTHVHLSLELVAYILAYEVCQWRCVFVDYVQCLSLFSRYQKKWALSPRSTSFCLFRLKSGLFCENGSCHLVFCAVVNPLFSWSVDNPLAILLQKEGKHVECPFLFYDADNHLNLLTNNFPARERLHHLIRAFAGGKNNCTSVCYSKCWANYHAFSSWSLFTLKVFRLESII